GGGPAARGHRPGSGRAARDREEPCPPGAAAAPLSTGGGERMSHVSEDRLVDLALGAQADSAERDHLGTCPTCTATHSDLLDTVSVTRRAGPGLLVAPPPHLWDAIRSEIDTERSPAPVTS